MYKIKFKYTKQYFFNMFIVFGKKSLIEVLHRNMAENMQAIFSPRCNVYGKGHRGQFTGQ